MLPRKPPVFRALPSITLLLKPFGVREFLDRSSTVQLAHQWCNFPGERHSKPRQSEEGSTTSRHCICECNAVVVLVKVRFRFWLNLPVSNDLVWSHSLHKTQVSIQ